MITKQRGFLSLVSVALIIIVASITLIASHFMLRDMHASQDEHASMQAFYIAEAGLERGLHGLNDPVLANRLNCSNVSSANSSFGKGAFVLTGSTQNPTPVTRLASAVTATSNTLILNSAAAYANSGRVVLDNESIDYQQKIGNSLTGLTRGADGTIASAHAAQTPLSQNQCQLTSSGSVSQAIGTATRKVRQGVQLSRAFAVGDASGSEVIAKWDGIWSLAGPFGAVPNTRLNSIFLLSGADGWAVGDRTGGKALLARWNGNTWAQVLPDNSVPYQHLYGVFCHKHDDCWAVGNFETYVHWNGVVWTSAGPYPGIPSNSSLHDVYCLDTNDCWAVGNRTGGNALFTHWNGSNWQRVTPHSSVPNQHIRSVKCIDANDCWAVGFASGSALITHWDGNDWRRVIAGASVPNVHFHGLSCTASDNCWAVGKKQAGKASIIHWDGNSWESFNQDASVPNKDLLGIDCINANDCWAVGEMSSYENIIHWDGTQWRRVGPYASVPNVHLRSVSAVGARSVATSMWQEVE